MKAKLYLNGEQPVTIEAETIEEFSDRIGRWEKASLVRALVMAVGQMNKRDRQLEALSVLAEKMKGQENANA